MRTWRVGVCNERGFTLVELAMVLLVLGILSAVTMPRVGGMLDRQNLRHSINVVRGTLRFAQARAALTKRIYRLTFDLEAQTLSTCYVTEDGCQVERGRVARPYAFPQSARVLDVVSPSGEKTQAGRAVTHLHPSGFAEPSMIHISGANTVTLQIEPLTGRLKVLDGYVDYTTTRSR